MKGKVIFSFSLLLFTVALVLIGSVGVATAQSVQGIKKQIADLNAEYKRKSEAAGRDKNTSVAVYPWNTKPDKQIQAKDEFDKWVRETYDPQMARLRSDLKPLCEQKCKPLLDRWEAAGRAGVPPAQYNQLSNDWSKCNTECEQ